MSNRDWLEIFWEDILSEDAARTKAAFDSLTTLEERTGVYRHLERMASEEGWAESQRDAALAALATLAAFGNELRD